MIRMPLRRPAVVVGEWMLIVVVQIVVRFVVGINAGLGADNKYCRSSGDVLSSVPEKSVFGRDDWGIEVGNGSPMNSSLCFLATLHQLKPLMIVTFEVEVDLAAAAEESLSRPCLRLLRRVSFCCGRSLNLLLHSTRVH